MYFDRKAIVSTGIVCKSLLKFTGCQLSKKLATLYKPRTFISTKKNYHGTESNLIIIPA
jgi:hypothetical protein